LEELAMVLLLSLDPAPQDASMAEREHLLLLSKRPLMSFLQAGCAKT
jgi:hypothetical protein